MQPYIKASGLAVAGRLDGVSFEWARGQSVAILGPSGSGKTTLLRLLAGFDAPHKGLLEIDGEVASSAGRVRIAPEQRQLAFAFQEPALMPHLDAAGNVHLGALGTRPQRIAAARQALADVGLGGFEHRRMWQLSGGEAQRVQLARTLAFAPAMLLLDEPFASVDRMCRADLLRRIGGRLKGGAGHGVVAIVTHDPADALELCDTTMVLNAGSIVAHGRFDEIAAGAFGEWPAQFLLSGLGGTNLR